MTAVLDQAYCQSCREFIGVFPPEQVPAVCDSCSCVPNQYTFVDGEDGGTFTEPAGIHRQTTNNRNIHGGYTAVFPDEPEANDEPENELVCRGCGCSDFTLREPGYARYYNDSSEPGQATLWFHDGEYDEYDLGGRESCVVQCDGCGDDVDYLPWDFG